jgi:protein-tyrosine phosphatase
MPAFVSLVSEVFAELESGKGVALHCRQSIGRSALVAIGVLAVSGVNSDQAIEIVSSARGLAVPETAEQRQWIAGLAVKPATATR